MKLLKFNMSLTLKFILFLSTVVGLVLSTSFYIVNKYQERLIFNQIENEAKTIVKQIVITRQWIAQHGGVFVEKQPFIKPNPYLLEVGLKPEITDIKGKVYVLKNPALITRELSQLAEKSTEYRFKITSLKLINPDNAPDEFEVKAMLMFEKNGVKEIIKIADVQGKKYLRYVYPLYTEEACLQCHKKQGYKIGDIRGAISIFIPVDKILREIAINKQKLLFIMGITILSLIIAVFLLVKIHISKPMNHLKNSIKEFREGILPKEELVKTGDEFEEIYKAFHEMAMSIYSHNQFLKQKIKEATKELEEANKMLTELNTRKSDFIARAAHELRTPLTSIKGAIDYLTQRFLQDMAEEDIEKVLPFIEIIKRNSERLIRMVQDMLDLERIEAGVIEFNYSKFNLKDIIEDIVMELSQNNEKNVKFIIEIPENLSLFADLDKIQQVINNLLLNAIKFSPQNSEIVIRGFQEKEKVIVEIKDSGPGISPEEQKKIFEKFYKGEHSLGTGLGLTISKAIVEAHGGFIGVKSDGKHGSCFYFVIPYRNE